MTTPYFNYTINQSSTYDDGAGVYAENQGQLLDFENARDSGHSVSFIAFLGSFSQSFQSNWNQESVIGRMDDIATFKNTTRSISVEWTIPAGNIRTAIENLNRCNSLIMMLYPDYTKSSATVMSKPPLVRLRYANLIRNTNSSSGLLGYITSLNWNPVLEMGFYHFNGEMFPKVISISVEFTALHEPLGDEGSPTGFFPIDSDAESLIGVNASYLRSGASTGGGWPFGIMEYDENFGDGFGDEDE